MNYSLQWLEQLHGDMDRLLAVYLIHNPGKYPSNTTVLELMAWSYGKIQEGGINEQPTNQPD